MFENEIRELFDLSMRTMEETKAYVAFETDSYSNTARIIIRDDGFDMYKGFDGHYTIYNNSEILKNISRKEYANAKAHLERLLEEGRCGA